MDTEIDKYSVSDLINHTINKQPIEFEQAFNTLISDKLAAAVENKKIEIAQAMFNPQTDSDVEDEFEQDTEDYSEEEQDGETA